jgi:hypothetical protein
MGTVIGWYALERERAAPRPGVGGRRDAGSALIAGSIAGLMTALALALFYVAVRLAFLYLDDGFRAGAAPYACGSGPECAYLRALDEPPIRAALQEAGVRDAAGYAAFFLEGQAVGGATLTVLVLAGALAASGVSGLRGGAP